MIDKIEYVKRVKIIEPTGLSLSEDSLDMVIGDKTTLIATITPADATETNVEWTTTDESIILVEKGVVTAVGAGTATIVASLFGFEATCEVTVDYPELKSISLNKSSESIGLEDTLQLFVTANPTSALLTGAVWTSSEPSIATVDQNGLVTPVAAGTTTITVTVGSVSATCVVTVNAGQAAKVEKTATLSFANEAQRTSYSTSKQVWEQNNISFTNDKASSSTNVAKYENPVRLYQNSSITVIAEEGEGEISKIVFDANSSSYATALKNSIGTVSGATVTVSSDKVTVTFSTPVTEFKIAKLTAQVRLDSITVTYKA